MPEKIVDRNIVILPSKAVAEMAIVLSKKARQLQTATNFILDREERRPHITIHQFAMPQRNEEEMVKIVRTVAKRVQVIPITLEELDVFGGGGLFWNVAKERPFWLIHKSIVSEVTPLQEEYIMRQHAPFVTGEADVDVAKRRALHLYGNPLANPISPQPPFWPHITITSCKTREAAEMLANRLEVTAVKFEAKAIYITEVGPNGTCPNILHEIKLGK